jgi:hypothetical protein
MVISGGITASALMQLRMLARLLGQSGGLHLHSIWNQISTGVAAVLPSKAVFSSAPKFF